MRADESRPTSGEAARRNSPVPDLHDTVADQYVGTPVHILGGGL